MDSVLNKTRKRAGLLWHVHFSNQLPADMTSQLYITYVRPIMEYACPVWHSNASAVHATALERIQASVVRTILAAEWDTPKEVMLHRLDWPSLRWRRAVFCMGRLSDCLFKFSFSSGRAVRKPHQLILRSASSAKRHHRFYAAAVAWKKLRIKLQHISKKRTFCASQEEHSEKHRYKSRHSS